MIFDEATSALDYESERVIQNNMREIVRGRTVILIAHRLATVRACNRIISMADGKVVEVGTHDDLIQRKGGLYARLWSLQTSQAEGVAA
jgi:subfamily B ATP-binding cassette protein HlyB/CyaB